MKKLLVIGLCLVTVYFMAAPHVVDESRVEPAMWEIVGNEELEAEYKKSHPFLDDLHFWPVEKPGLVTEFGYSPIWDVLAVRIVTEDGGEETRYYDCRDDAFLADGLKETDDPDRYFTAFADGYLKVENFDLSEELLRYFTFQGAE